MQTESEPVLFSDLGLPEPILRSLKKLGYETPSPIQAQAIPAMLEGHNIIGQAQTGTGKTAAFALPILANIDIKLAQPQALVLTPTRELAIQVAEAFQAYARQMKNFHVLPIYGGADMRGQLRALKRGAHVIVGTPGRILDHLSRKSLNFEALQTAVLDEADEMLRMGFIDDVDTILGETPKTRQTALFSATMPPRIRQTAKHHVQDPVTIKIAAKTATVDTIDQSFLIVNQSDKLDALTRYLEIEESEGIIIFVRTRESTVMVAEKLNARGYGAAAINGDMSQSIREKTIARFKKGSTDILIATDVAARGIDVDRISHVINYDIPYDSEAYVHRIGRTGRAGRSGKALLFVQPREKRLLGIIEKDTKQKLSAWQKPTAQQMAQQRKLKLLSGIENRLADRVDQRYYSMIRELCESLGQPAEDIAAALLADKYTLAQLDPPQEKESSRSKRQSRKTDERDDDRGSNRRSSKNDIAFKRYRIEAGTDHGVQPKDIVGALANEAGLEREYIGKIALHESYSVVDLPPGMPKDLYHFLQKVRIKGQPMRLSLLDSPAKRGGSNSNSNSNSNKDRRDGSGTVKKRKPKKPKGKSKGKKKSGDKPAAKRKKKPARK